jgi:hypothetical protein
MACSYSFRKSQLQTCRFRIGDLGIDINPILLASATRNETKDVAHAHVDFPLCRIDDYPDDSLGSI